MKVVINECYGGFSLSEYAAKELNLSSIYDDIERTNERLIELVEEDSGKASGLFADLSVVDIPDEATDWMIEEYDGYEHVLAVVDGKFWWSD